MNIKITSIKKAFDVPKPKNDTVPDRLGKKPIRIARKNKDPARIKINLSIIKNPNNQSSSLKKSNLG